MLLDLKRNERRPEGGKAHRRWAAENEAGLEGANRRFARGRQVQDGPVFAQRSEKYYVYYFMQAKRFEETYGPKGSFSTILELFLFLKKCFPRKQSGATQATFTTRTFFLPTEKNTAPLQINF